jgi:hypothetical protein
MSTIKADGVEAATGTNTDLTLAGKGTGVPDLAAGFKVGSVAGVPTASIRDDAVTLAKLAAGTDGELITWDASGDPAAVAVGTATHVLTSNGAGAAPTFQAAAAGGSATLIGTSEGDTTGNLLVSGLSSTYDTYLITLSCVRPVTDSANPIRLRFGDSGGIDSGASDYGWRLEQTQINDTASAYAVDVSDDAMDLSAQAQGNGTGEGHMGTYWLNRPSDGLTYPIIHGTQANIDNGGGYPAGSAYFAYRKANITLTQVELSYVTGNVGSGRLTVWGIAHV